MFGIGPMELVVIAVVALIFVGPQRLPSLMSQFGKFFVQARRYSNDIRDSFQEVVSQAEKELRDEELANMKKELREAATLPPPEVETAEEEWQPHPPTEGFVTIEQVAAEEGRSLEEGSQAPSTSPDAPAARPIDLDEKIKQAQRTSGEAAKPKVEG